MTKNIVTYKGFNKDLTCRGYQFEIGKTFEHDGSVEACSSGFHACEYPLDCFSYYEPASSVYAICEQSGDLSWHEDDSKVASRKLSIKEAITIPGLVKSAIEYTTERCDKKKAEHVNGNRSASSATGYWSSSEITPAEDGRPLHAVAAAFGKSSKARAPLGSAILCVYRNDDGELIHIRTSKVGENGVLPDTWYRLDEDGEFVECD